MILALINFFILLAISFVHLYWAFGGRWGSDAALPELEGQKVFKPRWFDTFFVAVAFGATAFFHLYKIGWLPLITSYIPGWLDRYGLWLLAAVFILRAIGEFRYVGFFKRVRTSRFAQLDTRYYSPICLLLGINTILLIQSLP